MSTQQYLKWVPDSKRSCQYVECYSPLGMFPRELRGLLGQSALSISYERCASQTLTRKKMDIRIRTCGQQKIDPIEIRTQRLASA